ncbi:MAG TPA: glutaminase, partial [Allosphingosinicella sp.]|nr:glutaminase [Allosphingosinicella sp.]
MRETNILYQAPIDYEALVQAVFSDAESYRGHGDLAKHIPALAHVDPNKLGIAIALGDGSTYAAGDADEAFSIQSIATIFTLSLTLGQTGAALWNYVGREPAGSPFNALVQLESDRGKPRNPLTNAGAIVVCDQLIGRDPPREAIDEILQFLSERSGGDNITTDETVAMSESRAGSLNRSLANFIAAFGNLQNSVEDVLNVYFHQSAITMSCRQLAKAALYLAFDGIDPVTKAEVCNPSRSRRINALMLTSGHYDNSGDFAFRIGLPGKSGSGGGILASIPGIGAVCVWSPGLNAARTSLAGAVALEKLVERTGW